MLSYVKKQTVTITIGVSFFVFGFFIVANLLHLSERDVLVGLISGAVGGVTMLAVSLAQERKARSISTSGVDLTFATHWQQARNANVKSNLH